MNTFSAARPEVLSLILMVYHNYTVNIMITYQIPVEKTYLKSPDNPLRAI